ncbi:MAG TPA: Stp1/IreP family PP2C-type Ser/Thr phosphatase [Polyangiaceae bacterium]|nr:Stp1/IreP family PP2C-type Ser/Thr phosphatase [Polyangiaceae bacterium]
MSDEQPPPGIVMRVFGRTDVGQIREHNEDNFLVADLTRRSRGLLEADREQVVGDRGSVVGVCDGMGGAAAGEVASQLAVDIIYEKLTEGTAPKTHDELAQRLVRAVEDAGMRIFNEARADRSRRGMGTTSTIASLMDERLFVAQVGDSRAYVLRQGKLVQVSRDQSLVNQLIEAGQLTEEEAETFEHNNIILQALGTAETVQVDLTYVDLQRGDRLLLCSDGLSGMVRADELREVLVGQRDPIDACRELTDRANRAGGHDNITVIVADFDGQGLPPGRPEGDLAYKKYALPEPPPGDTQRYTPHSSNHVSAAPSEEATRESRRLKVGHTMVGIQFSLPDTVTPASPAVDPVPEVARLGPHDEPVSIPIDGLPPAMVGFMVIVAMVAVAYAGFCLLR